MATAKTPSLKASTRPVSANGPLDAPDPAGPYVLDSGDRLRVVVFGQEGLSNSYAVDPSGRITMPLIGAVPARGMTTFEVSQAIAGKLKEVADNIERVRGEARRANGWIMDTYLMRRSGSAGG